MILDQSNKRIEIVLSEAHATTACDLTASWGSYTASAFTPGNTSAVSNGTTPVVIVAAPASGSQRLVQEITLHNADTIDHTVTLHLIDGAATRIFRSRLVPAGTDFAYSPSLAVSPSDASYFSIVAGTPEILVLRAPPLYHMEIYSGTDGATSGHAYFLSASATGDTGDGGYFTGDSMTGTTGAAFMGSGSSAGGASGETDVYTGDAVGANAGNVNVSGGRVLSGDGDGGTIALIAGTGGGVGAGGNIIATAGATGVGGAPGYVQVFTANVITGDSGHASFGTGDANAGTSGVSNLTTGPGEQTGNIFVVTGVASNGASGNVVAQTGDANDGNAGQIIITGGAVLSGNGNGGDFTVTPGTGSGTGRNGLTIINGLPTVAPAVSGALWRDAGAANVLKVVP